MTASVQALLNPAGGLRYHWRALRHRAGRWEPFTAALATWLDGWRPAARELVLVGPSAGYCLPASFLARFAAIDAFEPDPLARLLFARRFPTLARVRWHAEDRLTTPDGPGALVADFPSAAFLFCNVLGQLPWLRDDSVPTTWKTELARALTGRAWATFHDRLSGTTAPRLAGPSEPVASTVDNEGLAARWYPAGATLLDHETADLFPGRTRRFLVWEIRPGYFHLIEAIHDGEPPDAAVA